MPKSNLPPNPPEDNGKPDELQPKPEASESHQPEANASDAAKLDPFSKENLERLRLSQNFAGMVDVKPVLTTIAVRKPHKQEFVRVRPGEDWQFRTASYVEKDTRENYLVNPALLPHLPGEVQETLYLVAMSRNSPVPFLWPCVLPGADGRSNRWWDSALEAAKEAEHHWVRVVSDMTANCYVPFVAQGDLPEPTWPEESLPELMRLAFKDRYIETLDHPVLKRLRGEI